MIRIFGCLVLTFALLSCAKTSSTGKVSLAVKVNSSRGAAPEFPEGRAVQTDSRSFTPASFKLPIMKISMAMADGTNEQILYQCTSTTEANCLVDLASQTALDAISVAARARTPVVGTYTKVMISTCHEGTSGSDTTTAKVTGTATGPDGQPWATSTASVVTLNSSTAQETDVGNWGCATKVVNIRGGIVVTATSDLTLTVIVDNYLAAYFNQLTSSGQGGCKASGTTQNGICVTYPALMGYVGTDTAVFKRFTVSHSQALTSPPASAANALIIVAKTSTGVPLMAYGRTMFTATSETIASNTKAGSILSATYAVATGGPTYVTETNTDSFVASATVTGTVAFEQGGSNDTYAAKFAAFDSTQTHDGNVTSKDGVDTWHYHATLLP